MSTASRKTAKSETSLAHVTSTNAPPPDARDVIVKALHDIASHTGALDNAQQRLARGILLYHAECVAKKTAVAAIATFAKHGKVASKEARKTWLATLKATFGTAKAGKGADYDARAELNTASKAQDMLFSRALDIAIAVSRCGGVFSEEANCFAVPFKAIAPENGVPAGNTINRPMIMVNGKACNYDKIGKDGKHSPDEFKPTIALVLKHDADTHGSTTRAVRAGNASVPDTNTSKVTIAKAIAAAVVANDFDANLALAMPILTGAIKCAPPVAWSELTEATRNNLTAIVAMIETFKTNKPTPIDATPTGQVPVTPTEPVAAPAPRGRKPGRSKAA